MKRKTLIICAAWLAFISVLFLLEHSDSMRTHNELLFNTSRALFERLVIERSWSAMHGGVYVPVTKDTRPNPYLEDPMRDIKVNDSLTLTKINPAYMTRQLSELSQKYGTVQIHLTSLQLVRPENRPSLREEDALKSFERGAKEVGEIIKEDSGEKFFYMAPLTAEKACLGCHAKHGYEEGEIRGGISIIVPIPHKSHLPSLIAGHVVIGMLGLFGILLFSSRLRKSYEIIERQAVVDGLTDISNRRALMEKMKSEFKRSARNKTPLSVIMIDIDYFKPYNDTYGHAAGDECLRTVAQAIKKAVRRPADFCARYGGEEFVVLLPDTPIEDALLVAEEIRADVENLKIPHEKSRPLPAVTISLGAASTIGKPTESYEKVLQESDNALYTAKEKGRNRVEAFKA